MKKHITKAVYIAAACAALAFAGCGSAPAAGKEETGPTLDDAIADIAGYFVGELPEGADIALVGFDADTRELADYAQEELWNRIQSSGKFTIVDRRNLDRIRAEMNYQMSGEVSDDAMRSIGKQFGVQYIVHGHITRMGKEYRIAAYAADVESAVSAIRTVTVKNDSRLAALANDAPADVETEIDNAVKDMARGVTRPLTVGIGKISLNGGGTVTNLSDFLKRNVAYSAAQMTAKFVAAADDVSNQYAVSKANLTRDIKVEAEAAEPASALPIQALVLGDFSPVGGDARVTLRLVSAADNKTLGSGRFTITAADLEKRKLSMYPAADGTVISRAEYEQKQGIIAPYTGRNNAFGFSVLGDDLDGVYYEDEYMTMRVYAEKDCYFKILHLGVNNRVQVLYPRSSRDDNFIRAGETRRIPDNNRFKVTPPFGEEYILAAAYEDNFETGAAAAEPLSAESLTRGIKVIDQKSKAEVKPLATAYFSYTTMRRQ